MTIVAVVCGFSYRQCGQSKTYHLGEQCNTVFQNIPGGGGVGGRRLAFRRGGGGLLERQRLRTSTLAHVK